MAGRLNKDRPDVESKHIDPKPTDRADNAHIADARQSEGRVQQRNKKKQQDVVAPALAEEYVEATAKAKKNASRGQSKTVTILEIVAGSALTLLIEWLQLRRRSR